jgi:hypothetical protein
MSKNIFKRAVSTLGAQHRKIAKHFHHNNIQHLEYKLRWMKTFFVDFFRMISLKLRRFCNAQERDRIVVTSSSLWSLCGFNKSLHCSRHSKQLKQSKRTVTASSFKRNMTTRYIAICGY